MARDWNNTAEKRTAIIAVLRHFMTQDDAGYKALSETCLTDNKAAKELVTRVGQIQAPADAKVAFLPAGDALLLRESSVILEAPPAAATGESDRELLQNYLLSASLGQPAAGTGARDWKKPDDVAAAVVAVLRHLIANQNEIALCLADDSHTKGLFNSPRIGQINPRSEVKTMVMPPDQASLKAGSSLVLEIPAHLSDDEVVLTHLACCYNYWKPSKTQQGD